MAEPTVNVDPSVAIKTTPIGPSNLIQAQAREIDKLKGIIRGLTERTPEDLVFAVNFEISKVAALDFTQASSFIRETYNQAFFRLEHDVDYKVSLCRALMEHMVKRNVNYENPLIQSIADRSPLVLDLITPIWEVR